MLQIHPAAGLFILLEKPFASPESESVSWQGLFLDRMFLSGYWEKFFSEKVRTFYLRVFQSKPLKTGWRRLNWVEEVEGFFALVPATLPGFYVIRLGVFFPLGLPQLFGLFSN